MLNLARKNRILSHLDGLIYDHSVKQQMEIIHLLIVFILSLLIKQKILIGIIGGNSIKLEGVLADWQLLDGLSCKYKKAFFIVMLILIL